MAVIKVIKAKPFNLKALTNVDDALDEVAKSAQLDFQRFANSMDTVLPTIEIVDKPGERTVIPERDEDGEKITYLISGTAFSYAVMTPDFSPRTTPGSFNVRVKRGELAYIDTSVKKPGIEARDTHQLLANKFGPVLVSKIEEALDRI